MAFELRTPRLILRDWRESDLAPFAALNADPRVMEFLPGPLSREESDAMVGRIRAHAGTHGFTFWAAEHEGRFIGMIGLVRPKIQAAFTPCVEIGWRLAREAWKQGFATEGATAALDHAFHTLNLERIFSYTVPANLPSRRVMERLGMQHDPAADFDYPGMAEDDPLRRHVLYKIERIAWSARRDSRSQERER